MMVNRDHTPPEFPLSVWKESRSSSTLLLMLMYVTLGYLIMKSVVVELLSSQSFMRLLTFPALVWRSSSFISSIHRHRETPILFAPAQRKYFTPGCRHELLDGPFGDAVDSCSPRMRAPPPDGEICHILTSGPDSPNCPAPSSLLPFTENHFPKFVI